MKNNYYWLCFLCFNLVHMTLCQSLRRDKELLVYENRLLKNVEKNVYKLRYKTEYLERNKFQIIKKYKNKSKDAIVRVLGFYSFTDPDGKIYHTEYVADENGYRSKFKINSGQSFFQLLIPPLIEEIPTAPQISSVVLATLNGGGIG